LLYRYRAAVLTLTRDNNKTTLATLCRRGGKIQSFYYHGEIYMRAEIYLLLIIEFQQKDESAVVDQPCIILALDEITHIHH